MKKRICFKISEPVTLRLFRTFLLLSFWKFEYFVYLSGLRKYPKIWGLGMILGRDCWTLKRGLICYQCSSSHYQSDSPNCKQSDIFSGGKTCACACCCMQRIMWLFFLVQIRNSLTFIFCQYFVPLFLLLFTACVWNFNGFVCACRHFDSAWTASDMWGHSKFPQHSAEVLSLHSLPPQQVARCWPGGRHPSRHWQQQW